MTQSSSPTVQPLGSYLVEAGLITPAQIDVALNDQALMYGMRFGEILVVRGWIKQQTLDYLIKKIIEPEQKAARQVKPQQPATPRATTSATPEARKTDTQIVNRKKPESFDLDDVSWVG
jgi:hypothetical protein